LSVWEEGAAYRRKGRKEGGEQAAKRKRKEDKGKTPHMIGYGKEI